MSQPSELLLSHIWQAQWLHGERLQTTDGRSLRIVYRGRWSHGYGPDFQDALLVFDDGPLLRGDIEIHRQAADWRRHGHDHDPRYARVILHVALEPAPDECWRLDGTAVPLLLLAPHLAGPLARFVPHATAPLGVLGRAPCAGPLLADGPIAVRALLREAGLTRIRQKAAVIEASFSVSTPDQALYAGLLEALGYGPNREPSRRLAELLPLTTLAPLGDGDDLVGRRQRLAAALLGAAGFLDRPLSAALPLPAPLLADLRGERVRLGDLTGAPPPVWEPSRLRPANHPARRLLGLACLLAERPLDALPLAILGEVDRLATAPRALLAAFTAALWTDPRVRLIGGARANEIVVNLVIPFALAWAAWRSDPAMALVAQSALDRLPAGPLNSISRAMRDQLAGTTRLPLRSALEHQGLLHVYRGWCHARRCYECPVAGRVVHQLASRATPPPTIPDS